MHKHYNSIFGNHINQFIEMKRKLGYKYIAGAMWLYKIDSLAGKNNESSKGITKAFADQWSMKNHSESESNRYSRILYLAQFSSYLNDLGIHSYVPKLPPFQLLLHIYILSKKWKRYLKLVIN